MRFCVLTAVLLKNLTQLNRPVCELLVFSEGKATPLEAWGGPEGSTRLRLPDFKTIGT